MRCLSFFAPLFTASLFLGGCAVVDANDAPETTQPFEIHLQSHFDGEFVEVAIDGEVVFADVVETDERIGLATRFEARRPLGTHEIRVRVGGTEIRQAFTLTGKLYLGVEYYRPDLAPHFTPGLRIYISEEPFYYL